MFLILTLNDKLLTVCHQLRVKVVHLFSYVDVDHNQAVEFVHKGLVVVFDKDQQVVDKEMMDIQLVMVLQLLVGHLLLNLVLLNVL